MMKILIAPQAFKGTLTTFEAGKEIKEKVRTYYPDAEFLFIPISDGGDGFLDVMLFLNKGEFRQQVVTNALGEKVEASWGVIKDGSIAVIELAKIAGLAMIPKEKLNVLTATTYGVGEVIREALNEGVSHFYIGLGGSATCDCGVGLLQALGVEFSGAEGLGGGALKHLDSIDLSRLDSRVRDATFTICCDVKNVMTGLAGAARVYAPQKGADPFQVEQLELGVVRFVDVVYQQFGVDLNAIEGSGAAGGAGGGLHALLGGTLLSGIDFVLDQAKFDKQLEEISLVVTGEGKMDEQTVYGKGPIVIAQRAASRGIPVWAVVGSLGEGYKKVSRHGVTKVIPLS